MSTTADDPPPPNPDPISDSTVTRSPARKLLSQINRSTKVHIPLLNLPAKDQFRHNLINFIRATLMADNNDKTKTQDGTVVVPSTLPAHPGLKKIAPYWYPYTTMTKMRWIGRELLEVVSTEFRDRSMEYYRYALESGVTTVNGQIASPTTILRDGDRIENVVHRHEPPVTSTPVRVLYEDKEREFIVVDKPGSIPVHASGRYFKNTLIEILVNDFGYKKVYPANRLDRLTSGLMIIPTSPQRARLLTEEFTTKTVKKEYVARVKGKFPEGEIVCEQPMLTVDRQMGLNIVHPEGKPAKTVFTLIRYDANTDTSVVKCEPHTGRSHQLRVHLQYLGHPIANDPVYSETRIWGPNGGKGGIDTTPSDERSAPEAPEHLQALTEQNGSPESLAKDVDAKLSLSDKDGGVAKFKPKLLPRETGEDIGMGSPVPLSAEAVGVITRLRNMKDEDENWSRWRDVVFRAKGAMNPHSLAVTPPPLQNRRKRGNKADFVKQPPASTSGTESTTPNADTEPEPAPAPAPAQFTTEEIIQKIEDMPPTPDINTLISPSTTTAPDGSVVETKDMYCPECYLPLHPDPKPEKLYIFLHARKYTTSLGAYETEMPEWAAEGWEWDRS